MEHVESQFSDVYAALFKYHNGLTVDELFKECQTFVERIELSQVLYRASNLGNVYKLKSGHYRLTLSKYLEMGGEPDKYKQDTDESANVTEKIRQAFLKDPKLKNVMDQTDEAKPARVWTVQKTVTPKVETTTPSKPMGSLRRTKVLGGVALALFKARDEERGLTIGELAEWIDCLEESIYGPLRSLIKDGYIEKKQLGSRSVSTYAWTGKYQYPFATTQAEDNQLLKYPTIIEFIKRNRSLSDSYSVMTDPRAISRGAVVSLPSIETAINHKTVESIDSEMEQLQKRMNELNEMRNRVSQ